MPQQCRVCSLGPDKVKKLEEYYLSGVNKFRLTKMFGVSYDSVRWHIQNHMTDKMVRATEKKMEKHGDNLLDRIRRMMAKIEGIIDRNEKDKKDPVSIRAIAVWTKMLETMADIEIRLQVLFNDQESNRSFDEIDVSQLSPEAQNFLFEISTAQLGDPIQYADVVDGEDGEDGEDGNRHGNRTDEGNGRGWENETTEPHNTTKNMIRTRFVNQTEPESTASSQPLQEGIRNEELRKLRRMGSRRDRIMRSKMNQTYDFRNDYY